MTSIIYKAQWPLSTKDAQPMILIYPEAERSPWMYLPATKEERERLFQGKFVRVYFSGYVKGSEMVVEKFVRKEEWL